MSATTVAALGWSNCAQLTNDHVELLITLDVGPRILSYKLLGGENVLRTLDEQLGKQGESDFQLRGGHRIWIAPEDDRSYAPDNTPVQYTFQQPNGIRVETPATAPWNVRKTMEISLTPDSSAVTIRHEATNESSEVITIATWGLTVMAPGGFEIIPQPPLGEHGVGGFLPERVVVPWSYTDFSDKRWTFGTRFWRLTPSDNQRATKLGLLSREGWAGYVLPQSLFIKTVPHEEGATYPDFGVNFETFTKAEFIELETLSPLRTLEPGQSVEHTETWHLFGGVSAPTSLDEAALDQWLRPLLDKIGL